jgi:hypothetical protein
MAEFYNEPACERMTGARKCVIRRASRLLVNAPAVAIGIIYTGFSLQSDALDPWNLQDPGTKK